MHAWRAMVPRWHLHVSRRRGGRRLRQRASRDGRKQLLRCFVPARTCRSKPGRKSRAWRATCCRKAHLVRGPAPGVLACANWARISARNRRTAAETARTARGEERAAAQPVRLVRRARTHRRHLLRRTTCTAGLRRRARRQRPLPGVVLGRLSWVSGLMAWDQLSNAPAALQRARARRGRAARGPQGVARTGTAAKGGSGRGDRASQERQDLVTTSRYNWRAAAASSPARARRRARRRAPPSAPRAWSPPRDWPRAGTSGSISTA